MSTHRDLHLQLVQSGAVPEELDIPLGGLVEAPPIDGWSRTPRARALTPEYFNLHAPRFLTLIKRGHSLVSAAHLVGINIADIDRWLEGGTVTDDNPDPPPHLLQFTRAYHALRGLLEHEYLQVVVAAAKGDKNVNPKAAMWLLKTMFPTRYGDNAITTEKTVSRVVVIEASDADESTLGRTEYDK